jgi:chromate transporter
MTDASPVPQSPTFAEATRVYFRIGCLSFGGPAGQIALMHRELVEDRRWVSEDDFLHALNFCHLLPGPEAQQLATWIGWRLHGTRGGVMAGMLFVLPGALVMLGLSLLYAFATGMDWFAAIFLGIKAAVLAIVVQALLRIAGRALKTQVQKGLAAAAFLALFALHLPFPVVVLGAGVIGFFIAKTRPDWLAIKSVGGYASPISARPWRLSFRAVVVWGIIWALPMVAVFAALGPDHVLWDIGVFFSQLAVVTFGGAYAVLAYMAQEAVTGMGWLRPGEMADALGLAETTPGPLILVTQHVGFLAAFRAPEPFGPVLAGILGAGLTTWVTFAPCFLWIFAFAPWIDRMQKATALKGALAAVTAAVVGVIANLTLWFALHVLFGEVGRVGIGGVAVDWPVLSSLDWRAAVLTVASIGALFYAKLSIPKTLAIMAAAGWFLGQV